MSVDTPDLVAVIDSGRGLDVDFGDGARSRFHCLWLRENATDEDTVDPVTGQKIVTPDSLPEALRIERASRVGHGIEIVFTDSPRVRRYDATWLRARTAARDGASDSLMADGLHPFDADLTDGETCFDASLVVSDQTPERDWLRCIRRYGFARLRGVARRDGEVARVAETFGHVRETNYGRVFDVRAEVRPINLASTSAALQVHTDNPYRDPVPTLQLLHCLQSSATGGESVVVDGFAAAERLRADAPQHFDALVQTPVEFRFDAPGVSLRARRPLIALHVDGRLAAVAFNNRSMAATRLPYARQEAFYAAYRAFARELEANEARVCFRLEEGDLFIVDNRRVLHGRNGYTAAGERHLQGCYADVDGLESRLRVLEAAVHET